MQPPCNHQVKHEPKIVFNADSDALSDTPKRAHDASFGLGDRWLNGSQQKWSGDAHVLERLSRDAYFKCADVGGDIRKFRHASFNTDPNTEATAYTGIAAAWRHLT